MIDEDVVGLDVAVHDAFAVGVGEGVGDLARDARRVAHRQAPVLFQHLAQRRPVDAAHHDVENVRAPTDLVDRDDAGVLELRDELRFEHEPLGERGVRRAIEVQDFDRHVAAQGRLAAAEHGGEPALPEQRPDGKFVSDGALEALLQNRDVHGGRET